MNDARRKEIQRAQTLIGEAKGILERAATQEQDDLDNMHEDLQGDEEGQSAEDVIDALERAATQHALMRQSRPPHFAPLRRLGGPRACCPSRLVLGSSPVQECPWLPISVWAR